MAQLLGNKGHEKAQESEDDEEDFPFSKKVHRQRATPAAVSNSNADYLASLGIAAPMSNQVIHKAVNAP